MPHIVFLCCHGEDRGGEGIFYLCVGAVLTRFLPQVFFCLVLISHFTGVPLILLGAMIAAVRVVQKALRAQEQAIPLLPTVGYYSHEGNACACCVQGHVWADSSLWSLCGCASCCYKEATRGKRHHATPHQPPETRHKVNKGSSQNTVRPSIGRPWPRGTPPPKCVQMKPVGVLILQRLRCDLQRAVSVIIPRRRNIHLQAHFTLHIPLWTIVFVFVSYILHLKKSLRPRFGGWRLGLNHRQLIWVYYAPLLKTTAGCISSKSAESMSKSTAVWTGDGSLLPSLRECGSTAQRSFLLCTLFSCCFLHKKGKPPLNSLLMVVIVVLMGGWS